MRKRSWLFVPADSEKKLAKIPSLPADVFILDLEDSVTSANKAMARQLAARFIKDSGMDRNRLWVRINPLTGPEHAADLEAVMPAGPGGIMLPKARSAQDVEALGQKLLELESRQRLSAGSTRILPLVTETPGALFTLGSYTPPPERLAGLSWGAEDLSAAIGAAEVLEKDGSWTSPYLLARNLCLFAAHAAGAAAIDTIHADFRDEAGLARSCAEARRDGFSGKLAIHPGQVEAINQAFQPSEKEIEYAQGVVALFKKHPDAGVLELNGAMLDKPHLLKAQRLLDSL